MLNVRFFSLPLLKESQKAMERWYLKIKVRAGGSDDCDKRVNGRRTRRNTSVFGATLYAVRPDV